MTALFQSSLARSVALTAVCMVLGVLVTAGGGAHLTAADHTLSLQGTAQPSATGVDEAPIVPFDSFSERHQRTLVEAMDNQQRWETPAAVDKPAFERAAFVEHNGAYYQVFYDRTVDYQRLLWGAFGAVVGLLVGTLLSLVFSPQFRHSDRSTSSRP